MSGSLDCLLCIRRSRRWEQCWCSGLGMLTGLGYRLKNWKRRRKRNWPLRGLDWCLCTASPALALPQPHCVSHRVRLRVMS